MSDDGIDAAGETLAPGAQLGRYRVERLLGRGGMGAVYEATHTELEKRVALKTLRASIAQDRVARERFLREGRATSRIRHPNVVSVTDSGVEGAVPFLVMELLEGEDLAAHLARTGPLAVEDIVALAAPVCAAVAAAHAAGVVHRDLKPENVFLEQRLAGAPEPRVLDFGVSKVAQGSGEDRLTATGAMLGTPQFMSPEQAQGSDDLDARTDEYSLGVILYECATGRLPYEGANFLALVHEIVRGVYPAPRRLRPELPEGLERAITRAMALDRDARFPSVAALGLALLPFGREATASRWRPELEALARRAAGDATNAPATGPRAPAASFESAPTSLVAGTPRDARTIDDSAREVPTRASPPRSRWAWAAWTAVAIALVGGSVLLATTLARTPSRAIVSPVPPTAPLVEPQPAPPPMPPTTTAPPTAADAPIAGAPAAATRTRTAPTRHSSHGTHSTTHRAPADFGPHHVY